MRSTVLLFFLVAPFFLVQAELPVCCPPGWFQLDGSSPCYGITKPIAGSRPKVKVEKRLTAMCKAKDRTALPYHFNHNDRIRDIIEMLGNKAVNVFHTAGVKRRLFWTFETFSGKQPSNKIAKKKRGKAIARKHPCLLYVVSRNRHVPSKCNVKWPGLCISPVPSTPCPIFWAAWGDYDACSAPCDGGTQTRHRDCVNEALDIVTMDEYCITGPSNETLACNTEPCPRSWGPWGAYDTCSEPCGPGTYTRHRDCLNEVTSAVETDDMCTPGDPEEITPCEIVGCPVDGGWSDWSVVCDGTTLSGTETRECNTPAPENSGAYCVGDASRDVTCPPCYTDNQASPSGDVSVFLNIESVLDCHNLCAAEPACTFLVYRNWEQKCWLKSHIASSLVSQNAAMSAEMPCPEGGWLPCIYDHTDYPGGDIGAIEGITSAADCQAQCQADPTCVAFTWSGSADRCHPKHTLVIEDMTATPSDLWSGPRDCPAGTILPP